MQTRNTRLGLVLFAVYLLFYGGFVLLAAFSPESLAVLPWAGVNLAIWYGFGLIVAALLLALVYGWACRSVDASPRADRDTDWGPAVIYETSWLAIGIFCAFVAVTLGISFYLGKQAKSSAGYFAAHGQIPWFVNGVAFAGDYLSAASFLGICGMIAFYGYDGFLYSIGYLAGWVVALFVVAEPMKRLGKFTFADALNSPLQLARHQAGRRHQHARRELVLSHPADGRRRRAGAAALGPAALGGRRARRGGRDLDRRDGRHGFDHLGAVHQGLAAGGVQRGADGADSRPRLSRHDEPDRTANRCQARGRPSDW